LKDPTSVQVKFRSPGGQPGIRICLNNRLRQRRSTRLKSGGRNCLDRRTDSRSSASSGQFDQRLRRRSGNTAAGREPLGDFGQHADDGLAGQCRLAVSGLSDRGRPAAGFFHQRHAKQDRGIGKAIQPKQNRPRPRRPSHDAGTAIGLGGAVDGGFGHVRRSLQRRLPAAAEIAARRKLDRAKRQRNGEHAKNTPG
jgi:hypothetical protein